jgi:hypothetical protein
MMSREATILEARRALFAKMARGALTDADKGRLTGYELELHRIQRSKFARRLDAIERRHAATMPRARA